MTCEIISTGGKVGNAVLLNGCLLFDCGISWKRLEPYAKQISLVFLTHIHADHFKINSLNKLCYRRPLVRFVCGINLLPDLHTLAKVPLDRIILVRPEDPPRKIRDWMYSLDLEVRSFHLLHDVPNVGWIVKVSGGKEDGTAMYATDTHHIPIAAPDLDLYMIEGNYTQEDIQRRIAEKTESGAFMYEGRVLQSHMSMETAVEWLRENADPYKSRIVFLHGHIEEKEATGDDSVDTGVLKSDSPPKSDKSGGQAWAVQ